MKKIIKKVTFIIVVVIMAIPTIAVGSSVTISLIQGKGVPETINILAGQIDSVFGRVEEVENKQIVQEQDIGEIQNIIEQQESALKIQQELTNTQQEIIDELIEKQESGQEDVQILPDPDEEINLTIMADGFSPNKFVVKSGASVNLHLTSGDRTHVLRFDDASLREVAIGVAGNETRSISFKSPEVGDYTFYCDVPGHRGRGEVGMMYVRDDPTTLREEIGETEEKINGITDLDGPIISNIEVSSIDPNKAMITWQTDEPAYSGLEISLSLESAGRIFSSSGHLTTSHSFMLDNVASGKTYYFRLTSTDKNNNITREGVEKIVPSIEDIVLDDEVLDDEVAGDIISPIISDVTISSGNSNTAIVTWQTDEPATSNVEVPGFLPSVFHSSTLTNNHSIILNNIYSGIAYYFKVFSVDADDNTTLIYENTFMIKRDGSVGLGLTGTSTLSLTVTAAGFIPNEFTVISGETITLEFTSTDRTHVLKFDDPILEGVAIGVAGRETRTITFEAPITGDYTFYCDVPGHRGRGEIGVMHVD